MNRSLLSYLEEIPDFRRGQGRRFELAPVLAMVTMALMSGRVGLRATGRFMRDNCRELCQQLQPTKTDVPSFVTVRTIMLNIPVEALNTAFTRWAYDSVRIKRGELVSFDGKALGSTVTDAENNLQNFASVVSAFCQRLGVTIGSKHFNSADRSEVSVVRELIEELGVRGAVITADALHCTKKRSRRSSRRATTMSSASRATAARSTAH